MILFTIWPKLTSFGWGYRAEEGHQMGRACLQGRTRNTAEFLGVGNRTPGARLFICVPNPLSHQPQPGLESALWSLGRFLLSTTLRPVLQEKQAVCHCHWLLQKKTSHMKWTYLKNDELGQRGLCSLNSALLGMTAKGKMGHSCPFRVAWYLKPQAFIFHLQKRSTFRRRKEPFLFLKRPQLALLPCQTF